MPMPKYVQGTHVNFGSHDQGKFKWRTGVVRSIEPFVGESEPAWKGYPPKPHTIFFCEIEEDVTGNVWLIDETFVRPWGQDTLIGQVPEVPPGIAERTPSQHNFVECNPPERFVERNRNQHRVVLVEVGILTDASTDEIMESAALADAESQLRNFGPILGTEAKVPLI